MQTASAAPPSSKAPHGKPPSREIDSVTIRFAGDSGDGMQLTGGEFTRASALAGNDLATLPDYPAEIRAPTGTVAGVSGFQLQLSAHEVFTPGDEPDVLVAMNPAALKANVADVKRGGILIVNETAFTPSNLARAGYERSPLEDDSLQGYKVYRLPITKAVVAALADTTLGVKDATRSSNMWALGLMLWMYHRPIEPEVASIRRRFAKKPELADANEKVLRAGYNFGDTAELFETSYVVPAARIRPGTYRNITGNAASALGFVAGAKLAGLKLVLGSYPITPATEILQELAGLRHHGVVAFQAEDEIAGICSAIGASYGGAVGLTTTSGPGLSLKTEAMGLAVMLELPLVICNVQRGGPSTGLPTKTEQSDLLQALYGRHGESPMPVIAAASPADCFDVAVEAVRIATKYMTPVLMLTDGYLGNGSEPWRVPEVETLVPFPVTQRTEAAGYEPYRRNPETLAPDWVAPGTPELEHRVGGLEKHQITGDVSHNPENHEHMTRARAAKVARTAVEIPPTKVHGPEGGLLLLSWGGTWGAVAEAQRALVAKGHRVAHVHLRWLNPLPPDLAAVLKRFQKVAVCELNLGQLLKIVRAETLIDAVGINKVQGKPFKVSEIVERAAALVGELS
jgi:2-oxoglutarate ferredoxin oxidoreductase subunit alpha